MLFNYAARGCRKVGGRRDDGFFHWVMRESRLSMPGLLRGATLSESILGWLETAAGAFGAAVGLAADDEA